jgi:undecaprenyl-diphosphatase
MVTFVEAVILSFVQGITEWFPISSSGHLALAQSLLGIDPQEALGFTIYLHFASVLGVIILFWKDIVNLVAKKQYKYMVAILLAIIPPALVGIYLKEHVEEAFSSVLFMGVFFCVFGVLAYSTKYAKEKKRKVSNSDAGTIGVAQIFSLFPGISRSGMAISSGLILGLKKEQAIKFSFLIAIPLVFGASLVDANSIMEMQLPFYVYLSTFTITLLVSLLTIYYLIKLIKKDKFYLFGIYNFILGAVLILWKVLG